MCLTLCYDLDSVSEIKELHALNEKQSSVRVDVRVDSRSLIEEGPIWDDTKQVLYWVDIYGHKLHVYDPARKGAVGYRGESTDSRVSTDPPSTRT